MKFSITLVFILINAFGFGQENAKKIHHKHLAFLKHHKLTASTINRAFNKTDHIYLDSLTTTYLDSVGNIGVKEKELLTYDKSLKKGTIDEYILGDDYRYKEVRSLDERGNIIRLDSYRWEDSTQQYVKGIRSQSFRYNKQNQLIEELDVFLTPTQTNDTNFVELTKYYYAAGILYLDTLFSGQNYAEMEPRFETRYYYDGNNLALEEIKNIANNTFEEKKEYTYSASGVNTSVFYSYYSNGSWKQPSYGVQHTLNSDDHVIETVFYEENDQGNIEPTDKFDFTYTNEKALDSYINSEYNPQSQTYNAAFKYLVVDRDMVELENLIIYDVEYFYFPSEYSPFKINEIKIQEPVGTDWKTVATTKNYWSNITSINEFAKPIALNIYPNPTAQELHIKQNLSDNYQFSVVNSNGQTMISGNIIPNDKLDVRSLKPGNYILSIKDGNKIYRSSFIKY